MGPSLSNNAQGNRTSAPAFTDLPALWLVMLVDVNPGVTAFTLMPSPFNSCANAMVYEFTAALLDLYATRCAGAFGRAMTVLDPNSLETFSTTACVGFRNRGRKAMVVWMSPKKLVSITSRTTVRGRDVAFWFASNLPMANYFGI